MDSFLVAIYGRKRTQKTSEEKLRRGADCCCKAEAEKWIYYNTQWWCSILKPIYADKSLFNSYGRKLKHNVALPFYFFSYSIFNLFCGRWRGICLQYHPFGSGYTSLVKGAWDRGAAAGKLYHQVVYLSLKERRGEREAAGKWTAKSHRNNGFCLQKRIAAFLKNTKLTLIGNWRAWKLARE